jgi:glyoxylase-like metal-dependent hydrolase (beta-lactamase superfamily II)
MQINVLAVTAFAENVYIVSDETTKDALIVDPGGEAERILEAVEQLGVRVKYILDTHGHMDHVGGVLKVQEKTGAQYAIHENDVEISKRQPADYAFRLISDFETPPDPDTVLKEGDEFTVGNIVVSVIETPGHTMGSVCFLAGGALFAGDTLFNGSVGRTDFPGSSWEAIVESIQSKLFDLEEEVVVLPGHGPQTTIKQEKEYNPFVGAGTRPQLWTP